MTKPSLAQSEYLGTYWTRMVRSCVIKQARLEVIRIFLSFASHHNMIYHQMDVKCAFLNDSDVFPNYVFELKKALYGFKKAPCAWYEKLSSFHMTNEFEMSMMEKLKFFLGLQINQAKDGTYIHQTEYVKEFIKKIQS
ncbi:hypothetical protein CR513_20511, partial [Mucuna pruriens]